LKLKEKGWGKLEIWGSLIFEVDKNLRLNEKGDRGIRIQEAMLPHLT
jgi:hypothetical protein